MVVLVDWMDSISPQMANPSTASASVSSSRRQGPGEVQQPPGCSAFAL